MVITLWVPGPVSIHDCDCGVAGTPALAVFKETENGVMYTQEIGASLRPQ